MQMQGAFRHAEQRPYWPQLCNDFTDITLMQDTAPGRIEQDVSGSAPRACIILMQGAESTWVLHMHMRLQGASWDLAELLVLCASVSCYASHARVDGLCLSVAI